MKNKSLKEKFKNNILVKPLYKKVGRKVSPRNLLVSIKVDNVYKLEGDDVDVKRRIVNDCNSEVTVNTKEVDHLPGACEIQRKHVNKVRGKSVDHPVLSNSKLKNMTMLENAESEIPKDSFIESSKIDKLIQAQRSVIIQNVPDLWLRVIPLLKSPKETVCSVIFRCIFCQLGLATILILWTVIWVFVIHSFEGPYELQVSQDFQKEQNQLVIDLATELRQITPLSPKWREAIEKRIEEERLITILAVDKGARINPGQFWDLAGTFLFTVYVMTALGFGAPVPHTMWGRNSALIYAFIAVPLHIYLMVNMSTCLITNLKACCCRKRKTQKMAKKARNSKTSVQHISTESPSSRRNSEMIKSNDRNLRKKILRVLCLPCACRCVPLAAIVYYACGALVFGVLRNKRPIEIFMFPLEFTTTGGLEHVEPIIRLLYGLYVEAAMVLLSCALATIRSHSSAGANLLAEKYRLFQVAQP